MISILIPTYNRSRFLIENLNFLISEIRLHSLCGQFEIIVSDNCSPDNTWEQLTALKNTTSDIDLVFIRQDSNIGLEPNTICVIEKSKYPYILFTGDDDFMSEGYLKKVVDVLIADPTTTCIISGLLGVDPVNNIRTETRIFNFEERRYPAGFDSCRVLNHHSSQMSGLLVKKEGILMTYLSRAAWRNIYPFIFFASFNILRGTTWFLPAYKTKSIYGNDKDWSYTPTGLLEETLKNFSFLYPTNYFRRTILQMSFIKYNIWRLDEARKKGILVFTVRLFRLPQATFFSKIYIVTTLMKIRISKWLSNVIAT